MTPQEIINEAQLIGIRIILNPSGGLSLVGNTEFATETLKSLVTENRQQIIDYLKAKMHLCPQESIQRFNQRKSMLLVRTTWCFFARPNII